MKKLISFILAAVMLLTAAAVFAVSRKDGKSISVLDSATRLEGYVVGDAEGSCMGKWTRFAYNNPGEVEPITFSMTTYAGAYYDGHIYAYVYGYDEGGVLHDDFYIIDTATDLAIFPEGASSDGEFVYGMAYDYTDNTMYALCNEDNPYIASVDLETGELTPVLTVNLGSALGIYAFAIDGEGNFYALTFSAVSSKLVKINRQTGGLTELVNTGRPCFNGQSMTWDPATNKLFWAHVDGAYTSTNGLYSYDLENGYAEEYYGIIGTNLELMGLCALVDYDDPNPTPTPTPDPDPTPTPAPGAGSGDVNGDGNVDLSDALLVLRFSMDLIELDQEQQAEADINGDGAVDISDALTILRKAMGLI